jgi:Fic family protein
MRYIHELKGWPNLVWNDARLSPLLAQVRHQEGHLLGRMEGLGFSLRLEANVTTLTHDVVKSSAIEGEQLNAAQVRSSVARRLGLKEAGLPPSSRDVDGVVEMMLNATQKYAEPLTAKRLFAWHPSLFPSGRSGMKPIMIGAWRPASIGPMQVVSGPIGHEKIHFEAPSAVRIAPEMTSFLEWFEKPTRIDPVLKAGVAHFWFVTIHPFEDGNGRMARAIADLGLARAEQSSERFYSLSAQIERERKQYYDQLEKSQRGGLDITDWLEWFLGCLGRAITGTVDELAQTLHKAKVWKSLAETPVNERQRKIINLLLGNFAGKLTSSKYAKLTKCSPDTALRDIKELIEIGVLTQDKAGGRSTSYFLKADKSDRK